MTDEYRYSDIQDWVVEIETILNGHLDLAHEEGEVYDKVERHYDAANTEIRENGLTDEACYELESAYKAVDELAYEVHLETGPRGDQSWDEWSEDRTL